MSSLKKIARIDMKATAQTKATLVQAAALSGMDLTAFVLGAAMDKARRVLLEHATIQLPPPGQLALAELLRQAPAPSAAMRELMEIAPDPTPEEARSSARPDAASGREGHADIGKPALNLNNVRAKLGRAK